MSFNFRAVFFAALLVIAVAENVKLKQRVARKIFPSEMSKLFNGISGASLYVECGGGHVCSNNDYCCSYPSHPDIWICCPLGQICTKNGETCAAPTGGPTSTPGYTQKMNA